MPSARNCSMIADRPVFTFDTRLPQVCDPAEDLPAVAGQTLFEDLDDLLAGQIGIRRRPTGDERIVDDDRRGVPDVADVFALLPDRVAEDVFQGVRRRAHVEHGPDEARPVLVVVFLAVPGDVLALDDALAV